MAYGLKYYKELTQPNGKVVRLEILEKGYEGASKEIGPVCQALRLDIQGDTEIDAPIVKTSLSMTFVDAPDHADARTKKCGNWDEFYTSDATLWRVALKAKKAQETAFNTIWGGYITPDSYTEVLQYRGSVTIVARDNIGHMADFPFDAQGNGEGMISLRSLIEGAWEKIESPMEIIYYYEWMQSEGVPAIDTMMNVSAFEDMNWFEALESALYAYGATMRWIGANEVAVRPLRMLPFMGRSDQQDIVYIEPTFLAGAERELSPAVKRIEESVAYDLTEHVNAPMGESVTFTGSSATIPFESKNIFGEKEWKNIPTWPVDNTTDEGWGNDKSKTLFFSPKAYGNDNFGNELYIATNTDGSGSVWYGQHMQGKSFAFTLSFGQLIERLASGGVTPIYLLPITAKKVDVVVSASANGITSYLNTNGAWQTSETVLSLDINEELKSVTKDVALGAFSLDESLVKITIKNVTLGARGGEEWWDTSNGLGIYVAVNALTFADSNGEPLCETNRVNTNYNDKNNIILSRDPKLAPALNDVLFPAIIKNGIFVKDGKTYNPARTWAWEGHTPQQMAVYNHLQLLCYHAKPNNILRGTIVNANITDLRNLWVWHNTEHMLVSGSLNFMNGYIENAVLREFQWYGLMWGMLEPADFPEIQGGSNTNVEGGAVASSEGARLTSTTTVNIGGGGGSIVLDTFMSDTSQNGVQNRVIKAYVDGLGDDITEAYNAAISALNSEITNALSGKVDNATFNSLSTQVATYKTDIATNKTNIGKLDTRLTTAEGEIDTLQTYTTWLDSVKGLIYKDGDNIKINTSLIVVGDTSSGGSGQDTPASGTVTGIKVGPLSTDILTPNNAGIIDMVPVLSSIDVSDQLTAYAKTADVNSALALKQDTISDLATIRSGAALGATALQKITKTMVASALGASTGGRYLIDTGGDVSWGTIPTKLSQFTDDVVSGKYLPLAGGTITPTTTTVTPLVITSTTTTAAIRLKNTLIGAYIGVNSSGNWFVTDNTWTSEYTLIHSGNIGSQSVEHSVTANRLSSSYSENINYGLYISELKLIRTNDGNGIANGFPGDYFSGLSVLAGYTGWQMVTYGDWAYPNPYFRSQGDSGSWSPWRQLAFIDDNVASATKLQTARTLWGQSFDGTGNVSGDMYPATTLNNYCGTNANSWFALYARGIWSPSGQNLNIGANDSNHIIINPYGNVTIGGSDLAGTAWKAYINGSTRIANVTIKSGALNVNRNVSTGVLLDSSRMGFEIETFASYVALKCYNTSGAGVGGINIASSGNALIGTTTDSGYKLDVNGTAKVNGLRTSAISIECDSSGNTSGYGGEINRFGGGQLWIQAREGGLQLGNAASTTNFNGAVTMSSTLNVGGGATVSGTLNGTQIRLSNYIPLVFTNQGSGTYTQAVVEYTSSGFVFERARKTDSESGEIIPLIISQRGGGVAAKFDGNNFSVTGDTNIGGNLVVSGDVASA